MTKSAAETVETERKPNRLVRENSPYLKQHAYNPVDWYPWGEEALTRARRENKPIFLSIGYSTCHWCHVMERESFENPDIAAIMNRHFVCIKVDREERPDLDKIYMTAVQATTGSGGWPMSVWLTPELKPFYCGTYYPPESRWGRPGFRELLERIHQVWESNQEGLRQQADEITAALGRYTGVEPGESASAELTDAPLRAGFEQFRQSYDGQHGGFGGAPKFPRPVVLNFLLRYSAGALRAGAGQVGDERARDMVLHTLRAMGQGGMFDQLGGGFHRYSVDERWLVSHFEKMLYDQAQLVASYVEAYQITREPFYAHIAWRTCEYVLRDLAHPAGGFYSAEDADSEGVEGKFYVWTREEIEQALGDSDRAEVFCRFYGVEAEGNWEHGQNVLHVSRELDQAAKLFKKTVAEIESILAGGRARLFAMREQRVRPHRDEKILTSWNGLMISALARAAQADIGQPDGLTSARLLEAAERASRYLLANHYRDGRLGRTATVPAVLDDYAFFATGLLDLYEVSFDPQWLARAIDLADGMIRLYHDPEDGGFFMTTGEDPSVILRAKEDYDGAEPSGNAMAAQLLLRLAAITDNAQYRELAERTLALFRSRLTELPQAVPQMLCALDLALTPPRQIVIAGNPQANDTRALLAVVGQRFFPRKVLMVVPVDRGPHKALTALAPRLESLKPKDGRATAYVCVNFACELPTTDPATLARQLDQPVPRSKAGRGE